MIAWIALGFSLALYVILAVLIVVLKRASRQVMTSLMGSMARGMASVTSTAGTGVQGSATENSPPTA